MPLKIQPHALLIPGQQATFMRHQQCLLHVRDWRGSVRGMISAGVAMIIAGNRSCVETKAKT